VVSRFLLGFDGRDDTCYPQVGVDINFDLLFGTDQSRRHRGAESGPVDSNRMLEFGNPNFVLMDRIADPAAVEFLDRHGAWVGFTATVAQSCGAAKQFLMIQSGELRGRSSSTIVG